MSYMVLGNTPELESPLNQSTLRTTIYDPFSAMFRETSSSKLTALLLHPHLCFPLTCLIEGPPVGVTGLRVFSWINRVQLMFIP